MQVVKQKRLKSRMLLMAMFVLFDIAFSFFINTSNVYWQTIHFLFASSIFMLFVNDIKTDELHWKFLKIVFIAYWLGAIMLYLINMVLYRDFDLWLKNFNNYHIVVIVFISSTITACIYALKTLK